MVVLPTEHVVDEARARPAALAARHETERLGQSMVGVLVLALPLSIFALWYGFLDGPDSHPALKIGGAMALAGLGTVLVAACPAPGRSERATSDRSALVEIHPLTIGLAWASMGA